MNATNSSLTFALLLALAIGFSPGVRAEDKPSNPVPSKPEKKKPVPQQLSGKVVAVDKYGKSITLQVNGVSYVLQVADATRFSHAKREKSMSIADVVVGEQINVNMLLRELTDGRVEIAVLAVELGVAEEAQGKGRRGRSKGKESGGAFHRAPSTTNAAPVAPSRP